MKKLFPVLAFSVLLLVSNANTAFAIPITIPLGDDFFPTDGSDTHADLPPLPEGFFGDIASIPSAPFPGITDFPFEGNPPITGVPPPPQLEIDPFSEEGLLTRHSTQGICLVPSCMADTIVQRLGDAFLPNIGSMDTVPIQIVELQLKSVQPIQVTYPGEEPSFFDVFVELDANQNPGNIKFTRTSNNCGFFDSQLPINAILIFENQDPNGPQAAQDLPFSDNLQSAEVNWCLAMRVVGGEIIPIETTSLLLAGGQTFSWMIPVILSGIGIGLFVASRNSKNS